MPNTARIKQKEAFYKRMRGVKQLATEYLAPVTKVGGALVSAAKGEPLDITDAEVIEGILSGLVGGAPGGLPAGAVGTGITRKGLRKLPPTRRKLEEATKGAFATRKTKLMERAAADVRATGPAQSQLRIPMEEIYKLLRKTKPGIEPYIPKRLAD